MLGRVSRDKSACEKLLTKFKIWEGFQGLGGRVETSCSGDFNCALKL